MAMYEKGFYVIKLTIVVGKQLVFDDDFKVDYFCTEADLLLQMHKCLKLGMSYFDSYEANYEEYIDITDATVVAEKVTYDKVNAIGYNCVCNNNIKVDCSLCKHCLSCYDINPQLCPDFEVSDRIIEYRKGIN